MNAKQWMRTLMIGLALAFASATSAAPPAELPSWEQLTPEQRETLSAPLRERWNQGAYEQRLRWLQHAKRWQQLTPQERATARQGLRAYRQADPATREKLREVFKNLRGATPEQRASLREKWRSLSPEQRRAWLEAGGPGVAPPPQE